MENLLLNEIIKSARAVQQETSDLSPSYRQAMKNALDSFEKMGIPSKHHEDWIYTNISKNLAPRFSTDKMPASLPDEVAKHIIDKRGMIIFNNGIFNRFQSVLPDGISFDHQKMDHDFFDPFDCLNFSVATSPLFLKIKKKTQFDFPITIIHLASDTGVNKIITPRIHISAEEFSKVSILEIFTSSHNDLFQYTTNSSTQLEIKENASVEHIKIQWEANASTHIGLTRADLSDHAHFRTITLNLGNQTGRHNIAVHLNGVGSDAQVHALYLVKKTEHSDIFSKIFHHAPNTQSSQLCKGILADEATGAFTGLITVDKNAQKVSSDQLNKNLMLSKKAHVYTRPQLMVAADDVKCTHGATIGELSPEEEFYLETRGINKKIARKMLALGFAAEVLTKIENNKVAEKSLALLKQTFEKMMES